MGESTFDRWSEVIRLVLDIYWQAPGHGTADETTAGTVRGGTQHSMDSYNSGCVCGPSQTYLDPSGLIWTHLDPFEHICINSDQFVSIWSHLEPFGAMLSHFKQY